MLVHCEFGVSRSATVVAAYLMHARGCGVDAALQFLRTRRPKVKPNPGFLEELQRLEEAAESD